MQPAPEHLEKIHQHARESYPYECCGIIIGKPGQAADILFRCANIQDKLHALDPQAYPRDARTAFYIDPGELRRILKEADRQGMAVKLFYHSHPDHDAYFSGEDKRMALFDGEPLYPDASYLVVSVYGGEVKREALFSWDPETKTFAESQRNP